MSVFMTFENKGYFRTTFEITIKDKLITIGEIVIDPVNGYVADPSDIIRFVVSTVRISYPGKEVAIPYQYHQWYPYPPETCCSPSR